MARSARRHRRFTDSPEAAAQTVVLDVAAIRRRLRLTQREFAGWFGFPVATLRHWERGNRKPAGASLVMLHVIASNPRAVITAVRKLRASNHTKLAAIEPRRSMRAPSGHGSIGGAAPPP